MMSENEDVKQNLPVDPTGLDIISIQKDPFEGPAIRDERAGDVRVTLNTKEGMKRLHLFPRQARELLDALVAWMDAVQE